MQHIFTEESAQKRQRNIADLNTTLQWRHRAQELGTGHAAAVFDAIRRSERALLRKTLLRIIDNPQPIVADGRYAAYHRLCELKLKRRRNRKTVHLHVLNDSLLWCSERGHSKKRFGC